MDFDENIDTGTFKTPRNKRSAEPDTNSTIKKQKLMDSYLQKKLEENNRYSTLNDDDDGSTVIDTNNVNKPREVKPPVIILHSELTNPKDTYQKIQTWVENPVYFKVKDGVRHVYTANKADFYTIQVKFEEVKFKFQTYKPRDEIPKKMILKGIDKAFTADDILQDLQSQLETVTEVKQLNKTDVKGVKQPLNVYLVYFTFDTRLSVAKKILRNCCYQKINLEYFRKNKDKKFVQCYNCQGHGHQCGTCKLDYKCVKCTAKHAPGSCPKKREEGKAACVNCNGEHPANYRGCPKAQEYLNRRKKSNDKHNQNFVTQASNNNKNIKKSYVHQTPHKATRTPQRSARNNNNFSNNTHKTTWSGVIKQRQNNNHQFMHTNNYMATNNHQQSSIEGTTSVGASHYSGPSMVSDSVYAHSDTSQNLNFISGEVESLFGVSMFDVMNSINKFVPQYKQCTDKSQRRFLMMEFLFTFAESYV